MLLINGRNGMCNYISGTAHSKLRSVRLWNMQLGGPGNSPLWNGDSALGLKDGLMVKKQAWLPSKLPLLHQQPSHLARSFGYTLVMIRWGGKQSPSLIYGWFSLLCWCPPEWTATSPQPSVASKHSDEGKSPSHQSFDHVLQIKECVDLWTVACKEKD